MFDLLICTFLIVCAHLKINVGALFCLVFKEQLVCRFSHSDFNILTKLNLTVSTIFFKFLYSFIKGLSSQQLLQYTKVLNNSQ